MELKKILEQPILCWKTFFLTEISDCTETVTKVSIRVCNVAFKLKK